jgi:transposase
MLVALPPYCPELNPVERVWLYLKECFLSLRLHNDYNDIRIKGPEAPVQGDWPPDLAHVISVDHEGQTLGSMVS